MNPDTNGITIDGTGSIVMIPTTTTTTTTYIIVIIFFIIMDTPQQREGIVVAPNIIMVDLMEESIYISGTTLLIWQNWW